MDDKGHLVRVTRHPYPEVVPDPDLFAFDPERAFDLLCAVIRRFPADERARVRGIVIANQRATVVAVDGSGMPLCCLGWQDARCAPLISERASGLDPKRFRLTTGLALSHIYTLGKLIWLRRFHRDRFDRAAAFVLPQDYIINRLAGGSFVCDPSNASATGLFDLREGHFARHLLEAAAVTPDRLPDILPTGSALGSLSATAVGLTGLSSETLVILGGGDQQCAALGAGGAEGAGVLCLGTAGVLSVESANCDPQQIEGCLLTAHVRAGRFVLESFMNSFSSSLEWATRLTGLDLKSGSGALDPGLLSEEVSYLPFIDGVGTPNFCTTGAGALTGLRSRTDKNAILNAVAKGLALETRRVVEHCRRHARLERLLLSGGAAANRSLAGLLAAVLDVEVMVCGQPETTLVGAGMIGWKCLAPEIDVEPFATAAIGSVDPATIPPVPGTTVDEWFRCHLARVEFELCHDKTKAEAEATTATVAEARTDPKIAHPRAIDTARLAEVRARALEFAEVGTYRYRLDGTIVYMDAGALKLLEIDRLYPDPEAVNGLNIGDLFMRVAPEGFVRRAVLETGDLRNMEYPFVTIDGHRKWSLHDSYTVRDDSTGEVFVQVTARNITALKEAEERLRTANRELDGLRRGLERAVEERTRELRTANEALHREMEERERLREQLIQSEKIAAVGHLAAGVAHEFNNIMMLNNGAAELILARCKEDTPENIETVRRAARTILDAVTRGACIVADITSFARPKPPNVETLEVREVIEASLGFHKFLFDRENVRVALACKPGLCVRIDRGQFEQVFSNLLINACHAIRPKGHGKIRIETRSEGDGAQISISDDGVGMEEAILRDVFTPFFSTKPSSPQSGEIRGTGLGLAITYQIVRGHGGDIAIESLPEIGTTVTVTLPTATDRTVPKDGNTRTPLCPDAVDPELRILIVDDDAEIAEMMRELFEMDGCRHVTTAHSGRDGIQKFWNEPFDLVILDHRMPDISGCELFSMIRSRNPALPVLVMSGNPRDQLVGWEGSGDFEFVQKPFSIGQILAAVARMTEEQNFF